MEIARAEMLRVLKLAKTVKSNEAVAHAGKITAISESTSVLFMADAPQLEKPLGMLDVNLMYSMLGKCKADKVVGKIAQRQLRIVDKDLEFGYKLADLEVIEVPTEEDFTSLLKTTDFSVVVKIESLMRISDLQKTIVASEIRFIEKDNELNVIVGKEEIHYGKVVWKDMDGDSASKMKGMDVRFLSDELIPVIDALDHDEVTVGFAFNGEKKKLMFINQKDSCWAIGAQEEVKE